MAKLKLNLKLTCKIVYKAQKIIKKSVLLNEYMIVYNYNKDTL